MGLSDSKTIPMIRSAVLIQYEVHACDGQTDRQTELPWHLRATAYLLSRVKLTPTVFPGNNDDRNIIGVNFSGVYS